LLGGDEEEEGGEQPYDRLIMPRLVVLLEASDEFLRERVINLPEIVVVGTHNTDEAFTRRLTDYRAINTDDDTVLNYFDELEFHPERIGTVCSLTASLFLFGMHLLRLELATPKKPQLRTQW